MLTESIEVMKYIRASAGRVGISVVFEDVNQPRHDGKTIYLPRITYKTTKEQLKELMASVDHEVAHDRFSCFDVLKEKKIDPNGILMFVWNFLEDSRINMIEAKEYYGFRENWDDSSCGLVEKILDRAKKEKSAIAKITSAMLCWETGISAPVFPKLELASSKTTPDKKILDVLNRYSDRLVHCHSILDKRLGTEATYKLAVDILTKLGEKCEEELKEGPQVTGGKDAEASESTKTKGEVTKSDEDSEDFKKSENEEYKVITIKLTEDELEKYSLTTPDEGSEMGRIGINLEPIKDGKDEWDLTDYDKFCVVDYPNHTGPETYFKIRRDDINFLKEYDEQTNGRVISQENFAQQVRRLIQIKAKAQRVYGVKKGKLDQSRLSRICFDAPGFNERVFKNKIENKILDAAITVLVDMSGSMSGTKAYYALSSTLLVNEVCSTLNIPIEIVGFTDGYEESGYRNVVPIMFVYKGFSNLHVSDVDLKNYFAKSSYHMHGNPDGENILWAHNRLIKRKEKKKLLIVMSDGSPAASKSSFGISRFTEQVIEEIEASKVIDIYGLGLQSESVKHYYKAHSVVDEPEDIPSKLLELIERKILV
jgi:hypothetical protein